MNGIRTVRVWHVCSLYTARCPSSEPLCLRTDGARLERMPATSSVAINHEIRNGHMHFYDLTESTATCGTANTCNNDNTVPIYEWTAGIGYEYNTACGKSLQSSAKRTTHSPTPMNGTEKRFLISRHTQLMKILTPVAGKNRHFLLTKKGDTQLFQHPHTNIIFKKNFMTLIYHN